MRVSVVAAAAIAATLPGAAWAHKLSVYAEVQGATIHGEAYFAVGKVPAQGAKVEAFAPSGQKLAEATADAQGRFAIEARHRCDHRLVVNAGGGHGGEFAVGADELPASLPPLPAAQGAAAAGPPGMVADRVASHSEEPATARSGKPLAGPPAAPDAEAQALQEMIEAAVQRQVAPLARKLEEYQERTRLHDVLGGIGYILGITGMLFYLLGARKKR